MEVVLERTSVNNEQGFPVLLGVSAVLRAGESVAIVGRNGSGKTMLLRAIAGLTPLRGGKIRVGGADLSRLAYHELQKLRTRIGFVLELNGLVGTMTVAENLMLPGSYHSDYGCGDAAAVGALAEELDLGHAMHDRVTSTHASVRKRALYARALVLEPALLLVDQPQRGLSLREAAIVSAALERRRQARGMTVVHADDDGNLEPFVIDRSLYLEKGVLSAIAPQSIPPPSSQVPQSRAPAR